VQFPAIVERDAVENVQQHYRAGMIVAVRRQRWCVQAVTAYDRGRVIALSGIGASNAGVERVVLTPFDDVRPIGRANRPRIVSARCWRSHCRALLARDGPTTALQTAVTADIRLMPHQLEPALAIVGGQASRLLIADEVGLGKTIQTGVIVAELLARGTVERVLILTPAGLREQWAGELSARFGLTANVVDAAAVRARVAELPPGTNPWVTFVIAVASLDYVKRPEVLAVVRQTRWDVVVLDEAHNAAQGSDRHHAATILCERAPHVVLLTATPHAGGRPAFAALCRLGARGDPPDAPLVFRRTREQIGLGLDRRIHRLSVRPTAAERRMHRLFATLRRVVTAEQKDPRADAWLAFNFLLKRALSSPRSLELSLNRRARTARALAEGSPNEWHQPPLPLGDSATLADEAPLCASPILKNAVQERELLAELLAAARDASRSESKLAALSRLLRRLGALHEPVIVFTEYRDTLEHLRRLVAANAAVLHGGLSPTDRRAALDHFMHRQANVLLATDAGGEGLNLQQGCRVVVNLELPWNPTRLEQRAGRVDRIGQRGTVHVTHLIAHGTAETSILHRLSARVALAREDIGVKDPLGIAPDPDGKAAATPLANLVGPALREHRRLARARALSTSRGIQPRTVAPGAVVTSSTRWRTRVALQGRTVIVLRSTFDDALGQTVAERLTPLLVRFSGTRLGIGAVCDAMRRLDPHILDGGWASWAAECRSTHHAYWDARLRREQALAEEAVICGELQPGLFDRRTERAREADNALRARNADETRRRVTVMERAATIALQPLQVALVLFPARAEP
jgi:SNF2 family DNA or RNA helicase